MPAARRWTLGVAVLALVCAPILANIWPALGRGQMLYVGEAAATDHAAAAVSRGHGSHHGASSADADAPEHAQHGTSHAHHGADPFAPTEESVDGASHTLDTRAAQAPGGGSADGTLATNAGAHAGHSAHCALCVLASLAWAPQVRFAAEPGGAAPITRAESVPVTLLRSNDVRSNVHARAPPAFS